ncbi:MAG: response regulator transcription factor [bacterium]|nr:response regulator transcription factor [bacterium]
MKNILIASDYPIFAEGLCLLITNRKWPYAPKVSGTRCVISEMQKEKPDVVILEMSVMSGGSIAVLRDIRSLFPKMGALVLTDQKDAWYARLAFSVGARGYLVKKETPDELLEAIQTVASGEMYLNRTFFRGLIPELLPTLSENATAFPMVRLSPREAEVFELLGHEVSTAEMAKRLGVSVKTIESHRQHIIQKLSLRSGYELVFRAIEWMMRA